MSKYLNYKGYMGSIEYSDEDQVFHGKVIGIRSLLSFEGESVKSLTKDFHDAVDEYLDYCRDTDKEPEKPYKGSFNIRIGSELHQKAATAAASNGVTLNSFIGDAIRKAVT